VIIKVSVATALRAVATSRVRDLNAPQARDYTACMLLLNRRIFDS